MSPFVEWNGLLLSHFFSPAGEGEETWLHTTKTELDSIGLRLGGAEGLVAAIEEGPPWLSDYRTVADGAGRLVRQRKAARRSPDYIDPGEVDAVYDGARAPTYLPYLAFWVLASSDTVTGFYARVEQMSGRPFPGNDNSVREGMLNAWSDLELWTRECTGKFGFFAIRVLGSHRFVGIPRSQCLMSQRDKRGLPRLFSECGLRPRQSLCTQTYRQLSTLAANAYYLSTGLRNAFEDPAYVDPLRHIVATALDSWDGTVPRSSDGSGAGQTRDASGHDTVELETISVVLRPSTSAAVDWDIHWRIPAFVDATTFNLAAGDGQWQATLEEAGTHASTRLPGPQAEARQLVSRAGDRDVEFTVTFVEGGDENGQGKRKLLLPFRRIRTLAWDVPDSGLGDELIEADIPLSGPGYILFADDKTDYLARLLKRSRALWEPFDATGLPLGWSMGCVHHCDLLSQEERQGITGGLGAYPGIARVRLVGGRPLLRGGGRTYAYYDLPIVELEGPESARLVADGLEFTRLGGGLDARGDRRTARSGHRFPVPAATGVRRFAIQMVDGQRASFQVRVVNGVETVASTRLKVSVAGGTGTVGARGFRVGSLGQAAGPGPSMLGVVRDELGRPVQSTVAAMFSLFGHRKWKPVLAPAEIRTIAESVPSRFLDSLAQLGSVAYGTARDQLLRLAYQVGAPVQPALLLLELRGRGHLEIETDAEGHLVRVHAVPPMLYSLPLKDDGRIVRGVGGTLRLQHWQDIGEGYAGAIWIEDGQPVRLPVLRLAPRSENLHAEFIELSGMEDVLQPAVAIAEWASGIEVARSELGAWGWSDLATEFRYLQRFHPGRAEFIARTEPSLDVTPPVMASLYRFEDPIVQGLQAYVLGIAKPDGQRHFSFLQDSRWGIWLALSAFAEFAKQVHKIQDAVPWPIHYSASDGTLWLPARLRPPFVIERALLLCAASSPVACGQAPHTLSPVYEEMAGGTWLAYRWVPGDIATKVATLLGATLAPL